MRGRNSILIVLALAVVGVAWSVPWTAQANCPSSSVAGQPVSWYVEWVGAKQEIVLVAVVPGPHGIAITDVVVLPDDPGKAYRFVQRDGEGDEFRSRLRFGTEGTPKYQRTFRSGITFCAGSSIVIENIFSTNVETITITGYTY